MNRCKTCNEYPKVETERFIWAICEIRCPKCKKSVNAEAFWCNDAYNKAKKEWDKINL